MKLWQITIILLFFCFGPTNADVLKVDSVGSTSGTKSTADGLRPNRGMSMQEVEKKFGQPKKRMEPVGYNPDRKHHRAITRWQYEGYMVFFDDDKVIDTVSIVK